MSGFVRRTRGFLITGLGLSAAFVLASCSEDALTPGNESISAGTPRTALSSEFDAFQFLGEVKDVGGANDVPAQSDLNAFTRADNVTGKVGVKWWWDDVNSWTGSGQTGDACALFDTTPSTATKGRGNANFAVCVRISNPGGDPNVIAQLDPGSPLLYECGDSKADRCGSPNKLLPIDGIVCEVEKVGGESFFTEGDDGADMLAACSIPLSAMGATSQPNLLNVCSYPSGSPGSNPFDCVTTPGAGFIIIKKATTPQNSGVRFNFTISPAPAGGGAKSLKDSTSGVEETGLISAAPGTKAYSVAEGTLPAGWSLNAASCAFDRTGSPATGTKIGLSVDSVSVESGETTICTFDNRVLAPSITVSKTASPASIVETGDSVTFTVVVTNSATIPVTVDSLTDNVFGDLNGQGTCNSGANPFGSIAVSGSYTCAFKKFLSTLTAGSAHVDTVRAVVSSDGGPASAVDSAKVTFTDVLPDISVTKTVDSATFTASGGTEVAGFIADATYLRTGGGGGGGGGGSTPAYYGETCDDKGANDQPAQSDMNCFSRADNITGYISLKWTWDDINSWTGSGQTGDACALLDTDNNGSANFSFCARITNPDGNPNSVVQVAGSPILYGCKDKANDRCSSPISLKSLDPSSICTISLADEHFGEGEDGNDTQAECKLKLTDLANNATIQNIDLLNVCSYPSGSPNSNPFDCVVTPAAGFLVIVESTTPANANALFAFTLRNGNNTASDSATNGDDKFAVQGGATSAGLPVLPGTYSLVQQRPTNWGITSVTCVRDGNTVASGTSATQTNIPIVQGSTTTCTFVNTLVGSRIVSFTVTVTNNSKEAVTLFSLEDAESYAATFPASPSYSTLVGSGDCATGGSIAGNGGTYSCTFTRTVTGSPGAVHRDRVRAVGKDNELNSDTELSSIVEVTIN